MSLEAIKYSRGKLEILDQLLLPQETKYIAVNHTADGWRVINKMQVRGAPAIAVVGTLSLAVELHNLTPAQCDTMGMDKFVSLVTEKLIYLVTARPTAVNMADACWKLTALLKTLAGDEKKTVEDVKEKLLEEMEAMFPRDVEMNRQMARHGADHILQRQQNAGNQLPVRVLTHCNTGSLATAGYGTALGVVRALHERGRLLDCYCTETRPYNQGSRLTAYELVHDGIPGTLICDSAASTLLKDKNISAVLVGADRVVSNGDTANKIGTYQLAISARHHRVPFYVVAPSTSIDLTLEDGSDIPIEQRAHSEVTHTHGRRVAAEGICVWNPAFDVTPAELITGGVVTEFGVFPPAQLKTQLQAKLCEAMEVSKD